MEKPASWVRIITKEETQEMKFDKYDIALANGVLDEDSCPILTQICIRDGKLVVANGFMLVCRKADVEPDDGFTNEQVLIPAKMAKQIEPTAKKLAQLTIKDKEITATYFSESGLPIDPKLQFKADMNTEFPKWEQLFPKGKKHHQCAISIKLLRQLLSCLPKEGVLRMGFGKGIKDSVEFLVSSAGFTDQSYDEERPIYGCLMPILVQWQGDEWQRTNEEKEE